MALLTVYLNLSSTELERYYKGEVDIVYTRATNGLSVKFPASILRPFIVHQGVKGYFEIEFDQNHKFKSIKKLS
jgi:hypothetical protein